MSSNERRSRPPDRPTAADLETQPTQVTRPAEARPAEARPAPTPSPADGSLPPTQALPESFLPNPRAAPPPAAPSEERIFPPGTRIADRYRIAGVLGVGGMGVVYRAYDEMLDIELALKMLRPEIALDASFVERFRRELKMARQVSHRHVVSNYDVGVHEGMHFMTMDLVIGQSLDDVLRQEGKLPLAEATRIVRQVAEALAEAHRQGIVHRDLKPANILLDSGGDAYVTDFGIARLAGSGLTRTGEILGTPDYLSPEQARGEQVDGRSDVFTLGLIFIQLLSGKLPFPGGTLLEIVTQRMAGKIQDLEELGLEAPADVTRVIERCVAKDSAKRYQSVEELLRDLKDPVEATRRRRRTLRIVAWGLAAVLAAAVGVVYLVRSGMLSGILPPAVTAPPPMDLAAAGPAAVELPTPEPEHSVAILPFPEATGSQSLAWAANGIAEMLATALAENEDLRVVESVRVFQILQDLGFQPGKLTGDELGQLADLLRVDRLVLGNLRSVGGRVNLEMSLMEMDLPGSTARKVDSRQGELRELFDLVDQLALRLREALEVEATERPQAPLTSSATAMQSYTEGLESLSRRETLKAAPALEAAVAEDPEFVAAWVRLSQAYQNLGRYDEALEAAEKAVRSTRDSGSRLLYEAKAQEALLRGAPEESQRFLEELVRNYPSDIGARITLAEAYGQQGRFGEAVSRLEEAVEVDPGDARAWYLLGRFSIQSGDSRRAVDDYLVKALVQQKKLRNEQGEAEVHNALGVGYQRLGELDLARESYGAAAAIRRGIFDLGGLATTLRNLAMVHIAQGNHDEAETNILTALDIHKEMRNPAGIAQLYNTFGLLEEQRGRYPEALEHYKLALKERRDLGDERALAQSHANVGFTYYVLGDYDSAVLYLDKALDFYQKNEDQRGAMLTLQSIGFCEVAQGKWLDATESFVESLGISREFGEKAAICVSQGNLGLIAQNQGRYSAALDSYQDALAILAEMGDARGQVEFTLHRAEALLELGQRDKAGQDLEQVEAWLAAGGSREHSAGLLVLRGQLELQRGDAAAAKALFSEAQIEAEASQSAAALVNVRLASGLAALQSGDVALAIAELRPAAEEAERLGNAKLELHVAEALARAELSSGNPDRAEDLLRRAVRTGEDAGGYARAFRLHKLLAEVLSRSGRAEAAAETLERAREELTRVRGHLDEELRRTFDQLPDVRELLASS